MDISWAVDAEGNAVSLDHIDFVKCYNAMNQQCGWIGETSTEITGAEDLHLEASLASGIQGIRQNADKSKPFYDLLGRQVNPTRKGVYIQDRKKIVIK